MTAAPTRPTLIRHGFAMPPSPWEGEGYFPKTAPRPVFQTWNTGRGFLLLIYFSYSPNKTVTIWARVQMFSVPNRPFPVPEVMWFFTAQATGPA